MKEYIIFDIDGVLSNSDKRAHLIKEKGWDAFYNACDTDEPIEENLYLLKTMLKDNTKKILLLTGRSELVRDKTIKWFKDVARIDIYALNIPLYMRTEGDYIQDYIYKERLGNKLGFENILCVFEDSTQVVNMWRSHNVQCYQTCESKY